MTPERMTPEQWARIRDLFERCLPEPPAGRAVLLSDPDVDDALRAAVEKLLHQERQAGEFLEDAPDAVKKLRQPPQARFAPGDQLAGRYHVRRRLGCGGMGEVYAVFDVETQSEVALKVAHPDSPVDFRRELHLARQVTHLHVCRLFDLGRHQGVPFLTMELLEGETLAARLRRTGPLSLAEAQPVAGQLLTGLAAIHTAGIIHRDITPANVMLLPGRAVIMDFGLADRPSDSHTAIPLMGTLDYMAPEQLRGVRPTNRADIYSIGVVLHQLVTGQRPAAQVHQQLPRQWARAIELALTPQPAQRLATANQMAALLTEPHPSAPRLRSHRTATRPRYALPTRRFAGHTAVAN